MTRPRALALCCLGLMACDSAPARVAKAPPPPPLPTLSVRQLAPPDALPPAAALPDEPPAQEPPFAKPEGATNLAAKHAQPEQTTHAKNTTLPKAPTTAASAREAQRTATQPAPMIATTPKPIATGKVTVPSTVHVRIDLPAGLQGDLDKDARMQPWVNQVVATLDRCYASERKGNSAMVGTIEVLVTMHENERPDADIKQLPPVLSPIVACATGGLMRTKMPLFTGKESARYTVRLRFSP